MVILRRQQRIELALAVEFVEVVATADMGFADVDLRHGALAGFLHHFGATLRFEVDAHFFDIFYAFARQQLISPEAVQRKQITLNRADPAWLARMGVQASSLPLAVRQRGDQLTPIDLNQLAQRKAWGGP